MPEPPIRICLIVDDVPVNAIYMSRATHAVFGYEPAEPAYVFGWRELERNPRFRLDELERFADIAERFNIRGKFTYLPYPAGWGRIDQHVRGYSDDELARFNAIVRDRLQGRFDITPEILTHTMAILPDSGALLPHAETHWVSALCRDRRTDELADYLRTAYQILHNVGIAPHGLTLGGMPDPSNIAAGKSLTNGHHRATLARVLLDVERHFNPGVTDSFIFTGSPPISHASKTRRAPEAIYSAPLTPALSESASEGPDRPPNTNDAPPSRVFDIHSIIDPLWFYAHGRGSEAMAVDRLITHDLEAGSFIDDVEHGRSIVFTVHGQTLNCLNTGLGFKVLEETCRRMHERFGDRLQWCTPSELCAAAGVDERDTD